MGGLMSSKDVDAYRDALGCGDDTLEECVAKAKAGMEVYKLATTKLGCTDENLKTMEGTETCVGTGSMKMFGDAMECENEVTDMDGLGVCLDKYMHSTIMDGLECDATLERTSEGLQQCIAALASGGSGPSAAGGAPAESAQWVRLGY